jgi:hypothetical protein
VSQFLLPDADADANQIRIDRACANRTKTCMSRDFGFEIISDIQDRWQIQGGIDQPLVDSAPPACAPAGPGHKV